jgi:hypothetical protein
MTCDILNARSVFRRKHISMLRSLDCEQIPMHFNASQRTASRFQYIAVTDREHISKQWDWPPRLLVLGWLESKNGEKTFKI